MAKLTSLQRKKLPATAFAVPSLDTTRDDAYPIHDENHARNALARVSQFGTNEEKVRVRAAVTRKYPHIVQQSDNPYNKANYI